MKKLSIILAIAMALSGSSAVAATKSATPTPTVKATPTPTVKATAKPTITPSASAKPVVTAKPKPRPRKKISVAPSPKPIWPPKGFTPSNGIYAKVPTSKELVGVISAKGNLATQVAACKKFICGAVQVAAEQGCLWWEVDSKVYAQSKELLGNLNTITNGSTAREYKTILLVSPEPLESMEYIDAIEVVCHQDARPEGVQAMTYTKVG